MGIFAAQDEATTCPQLLFTTKNSEYQTIALIGDFLTLPLYQEISNTGEDCLNLAISRPAGTHAGDGLPVLVWIYGGGFEFGSTTIYDPTSLINSSVSMGMPILYVAMNFRSGAFGFLTGSEVLKDGSANLGLLDQRLALEWIADNIESFGGDPSKVTLWGVSSGSISVFYQVALFSGNNTYKGKPLFHGAIMDSGSIAPAGPIDDEKGQGLYDEVVAAAGCSSANDTLTCLRELDYPDFHRASNSIRTTTSYASLAVPYVPRPDGRVLADSPDRLVRENKYASVPFIVGDQEDEGTFFALFQSNITTTDEIVQYFKQFYFLHATEQQLKDLVGTYQTQTLDGSPFRTGHKNMIYPQFKRLAAIMGDFAFTLTRRVFLHFASMVKPTVPSWSYLASYRHGTPVVGTFHATDVIQVFWGNPPNYPSHAIRSYYFSFAHHQDPNTGSPEYPEWPQWKDGHELMWFFRTHSELLKDDFRNDSYGVLLENLDSFRL